MNDGLNGLLQRGDGSVEIVLHLLVFGGELLGDAIVEIALGQVLESIAERGHHHRNSPGGRSALLFAAMLRLVGEALLLGSMCLGLLERLRIVLENLQSRRKRLETEAG